MASIVEKESGLPQELPKIAGLYLHRLSIGMRLQADPTIIYGLGERYEGDLRTVDLRTDGPYNTYTRTGLPPTAIALPGAAAIEATAHPEKTDAIYFVASGKGDGSHVFSSTLEQHNAAVAQYLARQRQRAAESAMSAEPGRFLTVEGIEGVGKTTQIARICEAARRARHRARGDARTRRHAAGGGDPRSGAERARGSIARCRRAAAHVRRPLRAPAESDRAELEARPMGPLRSLHGCDLRLSRSGPRPGRRRASASWRRWCKGRAVRI